jgi:hypothetical protein
MFTSTQTYSPAADIGTRFMLAVACVRGWDQGRFHADAGIITLAGRSLR